MKVINSNYLTITYTDKQKREKKIFKKFSYIDNFFNSPQIFMIR